MRGFGVSIAGIWRLHHDGLPALHYGDRMMMAIVDLTDPTKGRMCDVSIHLTDRIKGAPIGVVVSAFVDGEQRMCLVGPLDEFRKLLENAVLK